MLDECSKKSLLHPLGWIEDLKESCGGQKNRESGWGDRRGPFHFTVNRIQARQRGWKGRQSGRPPESRRNWGKEVGERVGAPGLAVLAVKPRLCVKSQLTTSLGPGGWVKGRAISTWEASVGKQGCRESLCVCEGVCPAGGRGAGDRLTLPWQVRGQAADIPSVIKKITRLMLVKDCVTCPAWGMTVELPV